MQMNQPIDRETDFVKKLRFLEQFIQALKGQNNFCDRILFNLLLEVPIQSIEIPIGKYNWDVGTYRNKLKNVYYKVAESVRLDQMNYCFHHKIRNLQNICKTDIYFWRQNLGNNFDFLFNFKKRTKNCPYCADII